MKLALVSLGLSPHLCPCDSCQKDSPPLARVNEAYPVPPLPAPRRARKKKASPGSRGRNGGSRFRRIREQDKVCRYCLAAPAESVDHIVPVSRGGSDREQNLVGCCIPCNQSKADLLPKEARMILHVPLRLMPL